MQCGDKSKTSAVSYFSNCVISILKRTLMVPKISGLSSLGGSRGGGKSGFSKIISKSLTTRKLTLTNNFLRHRLGNQMASGFTT